VTGSLCPFTPRPIRFHGLREPAPGWRLKTYSITLGPDPDWPRAEPGLRLVESLLPKGPLENGRFGVGFLINHQGRGADYAVLAWWGRENELPIRVVLSERDEPAGVFAPWRPARGDESVCVWDLQVINHERDAWVRHGLKPGGPDLDAYLRDTLTITP